MTDNWNDEPSTPIGGRSFLVAMLMVVAAMGLMIAAGLVLRACQRQGDRASRANARLLGWNDYGVCRQDWRVQPECPR